MTDEEFRNYVLGIELESNSEGRPEAIWRLIEQLELEDGDVGQVLSRESVHGGALFPKVEKGPDFMKRAPERWRAIRRLKEQIRHRYSARRIGLMNYSARLFDTGVTADYLVPARMAEAELDRALQEAYAEAGVA